MILKGQQGPNARLQEVDKDSQAGGHWHSQDGKIFC